MDIQSLRNVFELLGFDEKQADIYDCLLQYPHIGLIDIARITKIPRTSLYDYYPKLLASGLISESSEHGRRIFFANDPKILLDKIAHLKDEVNKSEKTYKSLLDQYKDVYQSSNLFPKISYYSGESGLKTIFLHILKHKEHYTVYLGKQNPNELYMDNNLNVWFLEQIRKKGIISKEILYNDFETKWYIKKWSNPNVTSKVYNDPIVSDLSDIDKYIYGDFVTLIDYVKRIGIIIGDSAFANYEKRAFELLWKKL